MRKLDYEVTTIGVTLAWLSAAVELGAVAKSNAALAVAGIYMLLAAVLATDFYVEKENSERRSDARPYGNNDTRT